MAAGTAERSNLKPLTGGREGYVGMGLAFEIAKKNKKSSKKKEINTNL